MDTKTTPDGYFWVLGPGNIPVLLNGKDTLDSFTKNPLYAWVTENLARTKDNALVDRLLATIGQPAADPPATITLPAEHYMLDMGTNVVVAVPKSGGKRALLRQQAAETTVLLQRARDFTKLVEEALARADGGEYFALREIGNRLKNDLIDMLSE